MILFLLQPDPGLNPGPASAKIIWKILSSGEDRAAFRWNDRLPDPGFRRPDSPARARQNAARPPVRPGRVLTGTALPRWPSRLGGAGNFETAGLASRRHFRPSYVSNMKPLAKITPSELMDVLSPPIPVGEFCGSLAEFRRDWRGFLRRSRESGTAIRLRLDNENPVYVLLPSTFAAFNEKRSRLAAVLKRTEILPTNARPDCHTAEKVSLLARSSSRIEHLRNEIANSAKRREQLETVVAQSKTKEAEFQKQLKQAEADQQRLGDEIGDVVIKRKVRPPRE